MDNNCCALPQAQTRRVTFDGWNSEEEAKRSERGQLRRKISKERRRKKRKIMASSRDDEQRLVTQETTTQIAEDDSFQEKKLQQMSDCYRLLMNEHLAEKLAKLCRGERPKQHPNLSNEEMTNFAECLDKFFRGAFGVRAYRRYPTVEDKFLGLRKLQVPFSDFKEDPFLWHLSQNSCSVQLLVEEAEKDTQMSDFYDFLMNKNLDPKVARLYHGESDHQDITTTQKDRFVKCLDAFLRSAGCPNDRSTIEEKLEWLRSENKSFEEIMKIDDIRVSLRPLSRNTHYRKHQCAISEDFESGSVSDTSMGKTPLALDRARVVKVNTGDALVLAAEDSESPKSHASCATSSLSSIGSGSLGPAAAAAAAAAAASGQLLSDNAENYSDDDGNDKTAWGKTALEEASNKAENDDDEKPNKKKQKIE